MSMETELPLYRYPLPAHDLAEHEESDCGDPGWCLHEQPTERADPQIELIPVPRAEQSRLEMTESVRHLTDQLGIDFDGLNEYLRRELGWGPEKTFLLQFMTFKEFHGITNMPKSAMGGYTQHWTVRNRVGSDDPQDVESFNHRIMVPLRKKDLKPKRIAELNDTLWHELGHIYSGGRHGEERLYYSDAESLRESPKILGFIPVRAVVSLGLSVGLTEFQTLHLIDKEERFARAFARKHRRAFLPVWREDDKE